MGGRTPLVVLTFSLAVLSIELGISHGCRETERKALIDFKRGLHDPSNRISSWVGEDCCAWEGVGCSNISGHVIKLDLRNKRRTDLTKDCTHQEVYYLLDYYLRSELLDDDPGCKWAVRGDITPSLRSLQQLSHLDLSGNYFTHKPIPKFLGAFRRLTYLNLSGAGFVGRVPDQLGNLSTLQHLDLSYNCYWVDEGDGFFCLYLENTRWISMLTSLRHLNMNWVNLTNASNWLQDLNVLPRVQEIELSSCDLGTFPRSLSHKNFTFLITLDLRGNDINSTIPDWVFNITSLEFLYLGGNDLHGFFPDSVTKLTSLRALDLSGSVFQDGFMQLAPISNLCKLQILYLSQVPINDVLANLKMVFSGCLRNSMEELYLGGTQLSGFFPDWLGNIKKLKSLDLSINSLCGSVPASIGNLSLLQHLDLDSNDLNGTISEGIGQLKSLIYLDLSRNSLSLSEVQLGNLSSLRYLDISNNYDSRKSGDWIVPFSVSRVGVIDMILDGLPSSLEHLDLSYNSLNGSLPASLGNLSMLRYLILRSNYLTGMLPEGIKWLKGLTDLDLYNNSLSLSEVQLANLSSLKYLDISYNSIDLNKSDDWIPPFQLQSLSMDFCQIGPTPQFPQWLRTQTIIRRLQLSSTGIKDMFFDRLPSSLEYLDISYNSLHGSLPASLGNLSMLQSLILRSNYLNGTFPEGIKRLKGLVELDLYNNSLSLSEDDLANLSSLKYLDISYNSIHLNKSDDWIPPFQLQSLSMDFCQILPIPHFPKWLRTQTILRQLQLSSAGIKDMFFERLPSSLEYLDLSYNSLHGSLPASLGNLSMLQSLILYSNYLNGMFPEGIKRLKNLVHLDLYNNSLSLSEDNLADLSSLEYLDISYNSIHLNKSDDWIPSFQLNTLYMPFCQILPTPHFPKWLRTQITLGELDLSNTGMKEMIPNWLPSCLEYLDLSNNMIGGDVPYYFSNLTVLDLSNNSLSGYLPPKISIMMPSMEYLSLSDNKIMGGIPFSFCRIKSLVVLRLSKNNLSGELPNCWKNSSNLVILDLSSNKLQGGLPDSLSNLQTLQSLHLSYNNFMGQIPLSFRNFTGLVTLDLAHNKFVGNIPNWIGESLPYLRTFNLRSNAFTGSIPRLSHLTSLQIVDLSNNHLSGIIPNSFGNFSALKGSPSKDLYFHNIYYEDYMWLFTKGSEHEYNTMLLSIDTVIHLSNNGLSGCIPRELGNLHGLRSLNLSGNYLTGEIPSNIDGMQLLEILDLSRDNLSGIIPSTLADLNFLNDLNLSYNNLSGKIPTGSQLQTLTDPSIYAGNPNLCGLPLPKNCTVNITKTDGEGQNEDSSESRMETLWLYTSITLGFITGFWVICGSLLLRRTWRITYFRATDNMFDKLYVVMVVTVAKYKRKL
ncbi:receptor-like protein EIX2 [Musa acuminata AAA Group]|uniref:receptor-like protein EIX2 n=1 Tax=Musa acuminata AAA Group TaxID=214697 RepID=UPI0031CDCE1E